MPIRNTDWRILSTTPGNLVLTATILDAWPEVYPKTISVIEAGNILTNEYYHKSEALEKVRKVNKEALAYWNTLYSEC